jgi:uncharacterized membrane protein
MAGDPLWMRALLATHVAAGGAAFVLAPIALATAKGGKQHKRWGMVYFWAMAVVAATALPMALFRPVLFLALISLLAFYLVFSGYRVLRLKALAKGGSAEPVDWIASGLMLAGGVALVGFGWLDPRAIHLSRAMGYVAIVLGLLGTRLALTDLTMYWRKPKEKMFWWYSHLAKFIGSYIAAWTAFSTVTLPHIFPHAGIVLWLWPAAVGVPAIIATTAYYKRKFTRPPTPKRPVAAVASS